MKTFKALWIAASFLLLVVAPLAAQGGLDLPGRWQLTVGFTLVQEMPAERAVKQVEGDCEYQGTADVTQDGNSFSGSATLDLVQGVAECPQEMMAEITGQISQEVPGQISGQLSSPDFGQADFTGAIAKASGTLSGVAVVTSTPMPALQGAVGNWIGIGLRQTVAIPTLSALGLTLLVLLLLAAGALALRKRPA